MLVIQILDNGCGVDDSMKEKIFEAYVSTRTDGTGLGLSIVRQVILDHGGSVRVLDNQNFGTIVEFDIPMRTNDLKLSGESPKITKSNE